VADHDRGRPGQHTARRSSRPRDDLITAASVVHSLALVTRDRRLRRSKLIPLA
jgi:hypothetical protein